MKTAMVEILGKKHLICFSVRAKLDVDERFGSLDVAFDKLSGGNDRDILDTTLGLLEIMMRAGAAYAKLNDIPTAPPLSADELLDMLGVSDLREVTEALLTAIVNGARREVEADLPKNLGATPPTP